MGSLRSLRRREVEPVIMSKASYADLIDAVRNGTVKQVTTLLARGANPNTTAERLGNALDYALYRDDLQMAELLVSYMTDVNQRGLLGLTALHEAASSDSSVASEVCLLLVDHGADINAVSCSGRTPLMNAVDSKNFDIAKLLVDRGADATLRDSDGYRALDLLRRGKGWMAVRKLLEQVS